jgi:hypothetical protein
MCFAFLLKCEGAISRYEVVSHLRVNDDFTKDLKYYV